MTVRFKLWKRFLVLMVACILNGAARGGDLIYKIDKGGIKGVSYQGKEIIKEAGFFHTEKDGNKLADFVGYEEKLKNQFVFHGLVPQGSGFSLEFTQTVRELENGFVDICLNLKWITDHRQLATELVIPKEIISGDLWVETEAGRQCVKIPADMPAPMEITIPRYLWIPINGEQALKIEFNGFSSKMKLEQKKEGLVLWARDASRPKSGRAYRQESYLDRIVLGMEKIQK